jgi:ferrochelatase
VRRYLAEFLSDRRVVPLPRWLWLPVLYGIVLNLRAARSAGKYSLIWTAEGSPLAFHTERQARLLSEKIEMPVQHAMRYGEPAIASVSAFERVVPLYPQYSDSATGSVLDVVKGKDVVRDFHDHPGYVEALAANVRRHWQRHGESPMLLMSFHGLPERGGAAYEAQCRTTATLLANRLRLSQRGWRVTFQSRFGFAEWLKPYTQPTLVEMAKAGTQRVDVVCPGFVSDCLETLEEIGITAREAFLAAGGREFYLVPCLNESPEWISALAAIALGPSQPPAHR